MDWRQRISWCFGDADVEFGVHPLDEKRARELIKEAKAEGATRSDDGAELAEAERRLLG